MGTPVAESLSLPIIVLSVKNNQDKIMLKFTSTLPTWNSLLCPYPWTRIDLQGTERPEKINTAILFQRAALAALRAGRLKTPS